MKIGDVVRVSEEGFFVDPKWKGVLAIVTGEPYACTGGIYVPLRRIFDGTDGEVAVRRVEEAPHA